ncbi:MAG: PAS domain-containing protein, partial [Solirubrobacteraceae bacterium]|nr:PAS domain-containing protein [Solirubrobacteraceae bacterium]
MAIAKPRAFPSMNDISLAPGLGAPRVLLVAASQPGPPGLAALASALASAGYTVRTAPERAGLRECVRELRPDVVLSGVEGEAGLLGLPDVVAAASAFAHVPVVVYGEGFGPDERARGYAGGAADVLCGPLAPAEIRARVATQVELHRLRLHAAASRAARSSVTRPGDAPARPPRPGRTGPDADVGTAFTLTEQDVERTLRVAPDAVALMRVSDSRYLEVNQGFAALTGWPRTEAVGRTALELGLWCDPADRERFLTSLLAAGELQDFEAGFRRRDGS